MCLVNVSCCMYHRSTVIKTRLKYFVANDKIWLFSFGVLTLVVSCGYKRSVKIHFCRVGLSEASSHYMMYEEQCYLVLVLHYVILHLPNQCTPLQSCPQRKQRSWKCLRALILQYEPGIDFCSGYSAERLYCVEWENSTIDHWVSASSTE